MRNIAKTESGTFANGGKKAMADKRSHGVLKRIWEIMGLWPKISDPELERRLERFILCATNDQLFHMQQVIFNEAIPYLVGDERVRGAMEALAGKKVGLAVKGDYETTVKIDCLKFEVERGIDEHIPVISVKSRRDYADAVLNKHDPVKMMLTGRIRVSHMLTLIRWILPHLTLLIDRDLIVKYLGYQKDVEEVLDETLRSMGY